mmetsp:Transcript_68204/g.181491  ORF Transcript_68204/g.181491 Transcript_68204/m.181491 type:complete len:207 (+) Transcript_68204:308-928(+)
MAVVGWVECVVMGPQEKSITQWPLQSPQTRSIVMGSVFRMKDIAFCGLKASGVTTVWKATWSPGCKPLGTSRRNSSLTSSPQLTVQLSLHSSLLRVRTTANLESMSSPVPFTPTTVLIACAFLLKDRLASIAAAGGTLMRRMTLGAFLCQAVPFGPCSPSASASLCNWTLDCTKTAASRLSRPLSAEEERQQRANTAGAMRRGILR